MPSFASTTTVAPEKTRNEIERTLSRYGATGFFYGVEPNRAIVGFKAHDRYVRMTLPLADVKRFRSIAAYEQANRTKWRCLALAIKAKLEVVESGIATFEEEFLNNIVTFDGRTVGEAIRPALQESYASGKDVQLLLGAP